MRCTLPPRDIVRLIKTLETLLNEIKCDEFVCFNEIEHYTNNGQFTIASQLSPQLFNIRKKKESIEEHIGKLKTFDTRMILADKDRRIKEVMESVNILISNCHSSINSQQIKAEYQKVKQNQNEINTKLREVQETQDGLVRSDDITQQEAYRRVLDEIHAKNNINRL